MEYKQKLSQMQHGLEEFWLLDWGLKRWSVCVALGRSLPSLHHQSGQISQAMLWSPDNSDSQPHIMIYKALQGHCVTLPASLSDMAMSFLLDTRPPLHCSPIDHFLTSDSNGLNRTGKRPQDQENQSHTTAIGIYSSPKMLALLF